jgi:seryl-tRNA(Sec) selenium transferase
MAKIPTRLEDLLPVGAYEKVVDLLQRPDLSGRLRDALGKVGLKEMNPLEQVQDAWQQAKTWLGSLADQEYQPAQHWINATGSLFSAQMDRAPMIPSVGLSWARSSSAFHDRAECFNRSAEVMERSIGVKQCAWLSEPLTALQSVSRSLGNCVVIARCDCVRIAGMGDVRSMLAAYGNAVQEIGATNNASLQDWTAALVDKPGALVVLVSPSGLPRDQWNTHRLNAIAAARTHGAKIVEVLVDGSFDRKLCKSLGFPHPGERLEQGANVVILPTHFLVGGARGVLCLGEAASIQAINNQAGLTGCELDSAGIAANLLAVQLATLEDEMDCGLVGALAVNPENLRNRCQRMSVQLQGVGPITKADVVDSQHSLGPSPWDQYRLGNSVISLQTNQDATSVYERLRKGTVDSPSIDLRRTDSGLSIDLRFVPPDDDHRIISAVKAISN